MVYRQSAICRQIQRPTHASQMPVSPVSASKLKFWYLHGSWFWVVLVPCLSGAGQSRLPWGVLPAALGVTVPDDPASADALLTGGAGVSKVVFLTLATGLSFSSCSMLGLMGSRYFLCRVWLHPPHPWGTPHKLIHQERATFPQYIPYFPIYLEFCGDL